MSEPKLLTSSWLLIDGCREARRVWFWRHLATILTAICFFCGGILSEVIQAMLPVSLFLRL